MKSKLLLALVGPLCLFAAAFVVLQCHSASKATARADSVQTALQQRAAADSRARARGDSIMREVAESEQLPPNACPDSIQRTVTLRDSGSLGSADENLEGEYVPRSRVEVDGLELKSFGLYFRPHIYMWWIWVKKDTVPVGVDIGCHLPAITSDSLTLECQGQQVGTVIVQGTFERRRTVTHDSLWASPWFLLAKVTICQDGHVVLRGVNAFAYHRGD
jgi:hypothetical protein